MSLYTELNKKSEESAETIFKNVQKRILEKMYNAAAKGEKSCQFPMRCSSDLCANTIEWLESEGLTVKKNPATSIDSESYISISWDKPQVEEKDGDWVVDVKTSDGGRSVEVSAVVKGTHEQRSWGCGGEEKEIVLSVIARSTSNKIAQSIIYAACIEAGKICKIKNK
ncbi:hypothetical protein KNT62_gp253 [Escherichia phage phiC120]|uniref:Uncharacterized protein n=2 Tax=Straboviridae TaxID=2946170 RepID=A0A1W6JUN1_9CAUD|nr:hypothetical protein KNT62_gp253 [Escherichia phage phiC120]ARM70960.1 hypothetical protein phiC120_c255 [Escherichia phage phiC120]